MQTERISACNLRLGEEALTSRDKLVAESGELVGHGLGVSEHLLLVGFELWLLCLLQRTCKTRDGVVVGASLHRSLLVKTGSSQNVGRRLLNPAALTFRSQDCPLNAGID